MNGARPVTQLQANSVFQLGNSIEYPNDGSMCLDAHIPCSPVCPLWEIDNRSQDAAGAATGGEGSEGDGCKLEDESEWSTAWPTPLTAAQAEAMPSDTMRGRPAASEAE